MMRTIAATLVVLASMTATAGAQDATHERGKQVYAAQKCQVCHSVAGVGNKKGPLDEIGTKLTAAEIREWIVNAAEMSAKAKSTRKPPMKSYTLPKEDLDALVAYLQSLKKA